MSDEAKKMIDAAKNSDGAAFKASFEAGIAQKMGDALATQRQDVAQNVFGNIRVPTQTNEGSESEGLDTFPA